MEIVHSDENTMRTQPVLLLDVDEVLFPFALSYREWLLDYHGILVDYEKKKYVDLVHGYDWHETLVTVFMNSDYHQQTPVIEEAYDATVLLAEKYELVVCTARGKEVQGEGTERWLQEWVPHVSGCLYTRSQVGDPLTVTKGEIAAQVQAVGLIDDMADYVKTVPAGCEPFLLTRPPSIPSDEGAVGWDTVLARLL